MSEEREGRSGVRRLWKRSKLIAVLLVTALFVIVFFQNIGARDTYEVLFWSPAVPRSAMLLIAFLAGSGVGMVVRRVLTRRR